MKIGVILLVVFLMMSMVFVSGCVDDTGGVVVDNQAEAQQVTQDVAGDIQGVSESLNDIDISLNS